MGNIIVLKYYFENKQRFYTKKLKLSTELLKLEYDPAHWPIWKATDVPLNSGVS